MQVKSERASKNEAVSSERLLSAITPEPDEHSASRGGMEMTTGDTSHGANVEVPEEDGLVGQELPSKETGQLEDVGQSPQAVTVTESSHQL